MRPCTQNVVDPMQRSFPDASAGLMMFEASIVPPLTAPAPTMVWISSMNRIAFSFFCQLAMTALSRCSNSPRYFVPASSAPMSSAQTSAEQNGGDVPFVNPQRQPLGDRRLSDSRLADEKRVVFPPAAEDLNAPAATPIELRPAADQRVDLEFLGRRPLRRSARRSAW
jgi:hypothetical protein